ncbi:unnamed protein product [Soboliphyme baturini]|uniref:G_PROTEIN_RECEP_F1_2 domain-containing protein n=1 Tax=Soboliphyme baturini TaxID=241478 RepID=A0A183IYB4_9BILA|nr:unnamed protein product [Soboliphyme baturini]
MAEETASLLLNQTLAVCRNIKDDPTFLTLTALLPVAAVCVICITTFFAIILKSDTTYCYEIRALLMVESVCSIVACFMVAVRQAYATWIYFDEEIMFLSAIPCMILGGMVFTGLICESSSGLMLALALFYRNKATIFYNCITPSLWCTGNVALSGIAGIIHSWVTYVQTTEDRTRFCNCPPVLSFYAYTSASSFILLFTNCVTLVLMLYTVYEYKQLFSNRRSSDMTSGYSQWVIEMRSDRYLLWTVWPAVCINLIIFFLTGVVAIPSARASYVSISITMANQLLTINLITISTHCVQPVILMCTNKFFARKITVYFRKCSLVLCRCFAAPSGSSREEVHVNMSVVNRVSTISVASNE